ncbi:MAG: PilZ domain-containing protein [Phycisphaerae bacterium]
MDPNSAKPVELPAWVREALEDGELTDDLPNKRAESRRAWTLFCHAQPEHESTEAPFTARVFNVCTGGIGFITRKEVAVGKRLTFLPEDSPDEAPVHARVVHCTRTVQGYKVGCVFEPA